MTDDLDELAEAAHKVMGDDAWLLEPAARPGNWLTIGFIGAVCLAALHMPSWGILLCGFGAGWAANERERQQIKKRIETRVLQNT